MNDFYSVFIDKEIDTPIYQQLGEALCELIEKGILLPNSKLPPIRSMANNLKINNDTVIAAYKYLENKKAVYSQRGSGTYVSPIPIETIPQPVIEENISKFENRSAYDIKGAINFVNTSLPEELFPVNEFKNAFEELLDREKGSAFSYQHSQGYLPLREYICEYLLNYGIKTDAENILIISGAQQGIDIISKAMISYNDVIFVEKPTFYGACGAFLSRGGQIIEISLENDGMNIDMLENLLKLYSPKFIYMMSYFQTPTGISYSMEKKRKILELAEKYNCYIVEEDNLFDFNYSENEIIPLKALDYKNRVIYIKSFSKILMPGLRIGLIVLPKKIMKSVMTAKYNTDIVTSGFIQKAFDLYLRGETWKNHIELMRNYGMGKYKVAIKACDKYLKGHAVYNKPKGGISIWVKIDSDISIERLCNELLERGVIVSPGGQFILNGEKSEHIRISFSNVSDDKLEVGIRRIGEVIERLKPMV